MLLLLGSFVATGCGEKVDEPTPSSIETNEEASEVKEVEAPSIESVEEPYFKQYDIQLVTGNSFEVPFGVATCEPEDQTKLEYKGVDVKPAKDEVIKIDSVEVTDDEDPLYGDIELHMTIDSTYRLTLDYFEYEEEEYYVNCQSAIPKLIDYYTGQTLPYMTYDSKAPGYDFTKVINWGGKSYNIGYSVVKNTNSEMGDWEADENDTEFRYEYYDTVVSHEIVMYIRMPKDYDGLMLYAKNKNVEFDNEMRYEHKTDDSVVLFDDKSNGDPSEYLFVKVSELLKN